MVKRAGLSSVTYKRERSLFGVLDHSRNLKIVALVTGLRRRCAAQLAATM